MAAAALCCQHFLMAVVCPAGFTLVSVFTPVLRWLKQNDPFSLNETNFLIDFPAMPTAEEFPLCNYWPFSQDEKIGI